MYAGFNHSTYMRMEEAHPMQRDKEIPAERLSKMAEVCLRIASHGDVDGLLQEVIEGARSLTDARYGALVSFDDSGGIRALVTSGLTPEEHKRMGSLPKGLGLLGYLNEIPRPLRLTDIASHPRSVGFPENHPPMRSFLGAPMCHMGEPVGNIYLTEKGGGAKFTLEDEDTLVLFAAQAAMVVANALSNRAEQQARADLEALLNISPVGVLVFDAKTRVLESANEETRRIIGRLNMTGRPMNELLEVITLRTLDGRDIPPDERPIAKALRNGETVLADEVVIHLPDGRAIPTLINARPVYREDGEVVSVVATIQDITSLQEMRRQRTEFLGMVSHELQTPLTSIKGSTSTLLGSPYPPDPGQIRQFLRIIDEQADRMQHLIDSLVDLTHIEAGTLSVTQEPTGVAHLVDEVMEAQLRRGTGTTGIEVDLAPDLPRVMADRHRMFQVISSLISSASGHSPESSGIRIRASAEDVYVAVSVENEERSSTADLVPHHFSEFPRIGGDYVGGTKGMDDLSIVVCRGIVEAHGGRMTTETVGPERGVRYTFRIPMVDEIAHSAETAQVQLNTDSRQPERGKPHILAVDDDPQTRRYIRSILSESGFTTVVAGLPEDIVPLVAEEQPHLLLLDLTLSWSDGFELMERIRKISDAPVIFLSGHGSIQNLDRAFELGAADYVAKPFTPTELTARIKAALRRRQALHQTGSPGLFVLGDLTIDYAQRLVTVAGRNLQLTATEFKLLFQLSVAAGRVLTHEQLLREVWGPLYESDARTLRTYIKGLRKKLGDDAKRPTYIFTEQRVGYRMARPTTA